MPAMISLRLSGRASRPWGAPAGFVAEAKSSAVHVRTAGREPSGADAVFSGPG